MKKIVLLGLLLAVSVFAEEKKETFYHIVDYSEYHSSFKGDVYYATSLKEEGFVHFATRGQLLDIANKYYKGKHGLILLEIKLKSNDSFLRWENSYPHYYNGVNIEQVSNIYLLSPRINGEFSFPDENLSISSKPKCLEKKFLCTTYCSDGYAYDIDYWSTSCGRGNAYRVPYLGRSGECDWSTDGEIKILSCRR
jgi:uncharacterized protein (DUF952 family)